MKPCVARSFVFLSLFGSALAAAQQTTFADVANGAAAPASIKIADLTADFKAIRLHSAGESSSGMMGSFSSMMMMAGMGGNGQGAGKLMPSIFELGGLNDLVWTKGQTLSLAGHDFLITYRLNTGLDASSMSGQNPKLAANLTLDLVRTDMVTSIAPDPTMTPDSLRKVLRAAGAASDVSPIRAQGSAGGEDAILAAILFPVFAQAKVAAQETATLSNAKQIDLAMLMYAIDYDDVYPYVQSTSQLVGILHPYSRNDAIWESKNPKGGGFRFAMNLAGVAETAVEDPATTPVIYESNAWPDGKRCVAFVDGHAKRVTADEWAALEPRLQKKFPRTAKAPIKG